LPGTQPGQALQEPAADQLGHQFVRSVKVILLVGVVQGLSVVQRGQPDSVVRAQRQVQGDRELVAQERRLGVQDGHEGEQLPGIGRKSLNAVADQRIVGPLGSLLAGDRGELPADGPGHPSRRASRFLFNVFRRGEQADRAQAQRFGENPGIGLRPVADGFSVPAHLLKRRR
jgi:hypothetical protein